MFGKGMTRTVVALVALLLLLAPAAAAEKKSKKKKALPKGTPVLWRDRDPAKLDLAAGPGGAGMRPATRGLRLLKEE